MAELNIPIEVKDKSAFPQLKKIDRMTVAYAVLFGVDNQTAYALYHPEYMDASGKSMNSAGKQASRQFWGYGKTKDYREAYEQELAEFLGHGTTIESYEESEDIDGDALARKILSDLAAMIRNGRIQDYEVLKIATDILNKYGVLKGSEEKVLPPIRVLPTRCKSECRYRKFVETAKAEGQIADDCDYCKARAFAEEHGFKYDPCTVLNLPEDVVTKIDEYNDIKLTDILSGKVDN